MTNEIVKKDKSIEPAALTAELLIQQGIEKGISVGTMERLLAMRKELKQEFAKEKFDEAMAKFQSECPEIKKTKEVKTKSGIVAYRYAPIENIIKQVKKLLADNGLSYSTQVINNKDTVKAVCIVKHTAGHSENYEMEVPLGNKTDVMSNSQVMAAAATFAKRYAFCNAFGIMTADEDTDAKPTTATKKQYTVKEVIEKIKACKTKVKADEWRKWIEKQPYNETQKNLLYRTIEELTYAA